MGVVTRTTRAKGRWSPGGLGAGEGLPPWVWTRLSSRCVEDGQEGRGRERREAGRGVAEVRPWQLSKEEPQKCARQLWVLRACGQGRLRPGAQQLAGPGPEPQGWRREVKCWPFVVP